MESFKFLGGKPTILQLKDFAWEFSKPLRFHAKGCLIGKSIYRTFVISGINEGRLTTFDEVRYEIMTLSTDPDTILEGEEYYVGEFYTIDNGEDYDNETIQNELDIEPQ
jgi:hypothetical protein